MIREYQGDMDFYSVLGLYESVNWSAYTNSPGKLKSALEHSTLVLLAEIEGEIVGLARCLSDSETICYVQDILVRPKNQRSSIGTELLKRILHNYSSVRQIVLMTDSEERQLSFYKSMGFTEISGNLRGFVKFQT